MILGIQYLRAIAALMVVFHHSRNYFGSHGAALTAVGTAGVDIFFVISGFVMAYSTRGFHTDGRFALQASHFLQNRIVRIVPLYWLALLWTAKSDIINGVVTLGLIGDFFFIPRLLPPDYAYIWPILVPGWTLNYEMFFYLVFSISMLMGTNRYVFMSIVFLTLATLGMFIHSENVLIRFYSKPLLLEFMFGVLLYRTHGYWSGRISTRTATAGLLGGFAVLAIGNQNIDRVLADGIPAVFILASAIIVFENRRLPLLQLLGDASYSIYITHLFALQFAVHLANLLELRAPSPINMVLVLGMQIVMATILGVIVHKVFEKPVTSFLQSRMKKRHADALAPY